MQRDKETILGHNMEKCLDSGEYKPYLKSQSPLYYSPRVADRAFPQLKVSWRQPGDFHRSAKESEPCSCDVPLVG